jgi:predicted GNAT family acetyltransferase
MESQVKRLRGQLNEAQYKLEMSENVSSEELIDVIDLDPSNKRYDRYKKMLKDLYGIDYVEPKIRYKKETKLIKKYDNTKFSAKTKKGININVIVEKVPNLDRSLRITIYDESGDSIGGAGFGIDITNKKIRIGGAFVKPNMRRKGVYSIIADYIQKIAKENKLKIVDSGRSDDARAFWKNRSEMSLEYKAIK